MSAYLPLRRSWLSLSNGFTWDKAVISGRLLEVGFRPKSDNPEATAERLLPTTSRHCGPIEDAASLSASGAPVA